MRIISNNELQNYNDLLYSASTVGVKYSTIQRFYNIVTINDRRELRVDEECEDNLNTTIENLPSFLNKGRNGRVGKSSTNFRSCRFKR